MSVVLSSEQSYRQRGVGRHHPMGLSTGALHGDGLTLAQMLADAGLLSRYAVEVSALSGAELPELVAFLRNEPALPFRYLSVHAPAKEFDENLVLGDLRGLPRAVDSVIVHPDVISSPKAFGELGPQLVFENMDARKHGGRTVQELQPYFDAVPDAGFCFDIAHAWSLDPTMELAHELLDRFRSRLREVHLSSLDGDGHHIELRVEDEELFAPVLARCSDVPWILEALPPARWGTGSR